MALSDNALVTLEDVKRFSFGDMEKSKSQDDDLIENIINSVTSQFEKYCSVDSFKARDYEEVISTIGCNAIFVKNLPINSIEKVYIDGDWIWSEDTLIDDTEYRNSGGRFILFKYYVQRGDDNAKIVYNGGFDEIPEDLRLACIKEVTHNYKRRKDFWITGKSLEDGSSTFEQDGLLKSTKQVIQKYKNVMVF